MAMSEMEKTLEFGKANRILNVVFYRDLYSNKLNPGVYIEYEVSQDIRFSNIPNETYKIVVHKSIYVPGFITSKISDTGDDKTIQNLIDLVDKEVFEEVSALIYNINVLKDITKTRNINLEIAVKREDC